MDNERSKLDKQTKLYAEWTIICDTRACVAVAVCPCDTCDISCVPCDTCDTCDASTSVHSSKRGSQNAWISTVWAFWAKRGSPAQKMHEFQRFGQRFKHRFSLLGNQRKQHGFPRFLNDAPTLQKHHGFPR